METLDLVIIGAGVFGLCVAKTFHQLHPQRVLAVLEANPTLGGTWAAHRLYPGLKSNNLLGTYEYPDFPMDPKLFDVKPGQHIPGPVIHNFLTKYAEHFGIRDKIRFDCKVVSAEHQKDEAGGWLLTVLEGPKRQKKTIFARRLVLATGLTSEAFLPDFKGQGLFESPIFHGKDFLKYADTLESTKTVTVFGGTKFAWDVVYQYAIKGVKVNWVIRASGHGPVWMAPPYVTPLKKWLEKLVMTRALTWFSPCVWSSAGGYSFIRSFLHSTFIGRAITDAFWYILSNDVLTLNSYSSHPELAKLKPWSEAMFVGTSFSILNYETDFFELVKSGKVKVHIANVTHLSERSVHLDDGTVLESDALCCVTGWKNVPSLKFLPEGIEKELGLPHVPTDDEPVFNPNLLEKADKEILSRFPRLRDQPVQNRHLIPLLDQKGISTKDSSNPYTQLTPWTLYRFMIPPSVQMLQTRDIAFAGMVTNFSTVTMAHIQSIWICSYFNGELPANVIPPILTDPIPQGREAEREAALEKLRYETLLHARFGRWRYPAGYGEKYPDFVFDGLSYLDMLLKDLGVNVHRKNGWLAELFEPYGPEDYKGLVEESMASRDN